MISYDLKSVSILDEGFGNISLLIESVAFVIISALEKAVLLVELFLWWNTIQFNIKRKWDSRIRITIFFELIKTLWYSRFLHLRCCTIRGISEFIPSNTINIIAGYSLKIILILICGLVINQWNVFLIVMIISRSVSFKIITTNPIVVIILKCWVIDNCVELLAIDWVGFVDVVLVYLGLLLWVLEWGDYVLLV